MDFVGPMPDAISEMMRQDASAGKGHVIETYEPDDDPLLKVECALEMLDPDMPYIDVGTDELSWFKLVCVLVDNFTFEEGFPALQIFCERANIIKHRDENRNMAAWDRIARRNRRVGDLSLATIYHFADEAEKSLEPPPAESWRAAYWRQLLAKKVTT